MVIIALSHNLTLKKHIEHIKRINLEGSFYMRNHRDKDNRATALRLSKLVNCESDELAITRNTTESLDLIISGFPWKKMMKQFLHHKIMALCKRCSN